MWMGISVLYRCNNKKMNKHFVLCLVLLSIIVVSFFGKMFYPEVSVFITPEFGQSDLFNLNYPMKYFLHKSFANNSLPMWNDLIGTGFPQFAEGQIGALNITNVLIYKYLPFPLSINVAYVVYFLTAIFGTFAYLKFLGFKNIVAFFHASLFAFSGYFVTHIVHVNVIHASSYLPWIFLLSHVYIRNTRPIYGLLLSLVLAQQYFAGHPQTTFITLLGVSLLYLFSHKRKLLLLRTYYMPIIIMCIFFGLIAVQFIPSKELLDISNRGDGFSLNQATQFSFPVGHLMGFIYPNFLGSPQDGSYPDFNTLRGSIYWENTGYIGIIPLLFVVLALLMRKKSSTHVFYILLLVTAFMLMLGKNSPFHLVYTFPPFNLFRVPSRFILLFVWALTILSAYGFHHFQQHLSRHIKSDVVMRIITCTIVVCALAQLLAYGYTYNPIGKASVWLTEPDLVKSIPNNSRFYTVGSGALWNTHYMYNGWTNVEPYLNLLNNAEPNINVMYEKNAFGVYPILITNRYQIMSQAIENNVTIESDLSSFNVTNIGIKLLRMNNIGTIVSAMKGERLNAFAEKDSPFDKVVLYSVPDPLERVRMVYDFDVATTVEEFQAKIKESEFDPEKTVMLETSPAIQVPSDKDVEFESVIKVIKDNPTHLSISSSTKSDGLLVVADLYYPGWKAVVDGKKTDILAANVAQRAVVIPKGDHMVEFTYKPNSFVKGAVISTATHVLAITLVFVLMFFASHRKHPSTS